MPIAVSQGEDRAGICMVATIPLPLMVFMRAHIKALSPFYDLTLVANGEPGDAEPLLGPHVGFKRINIAREISVFRDFTALISLWRFFRNKKFRVLQSITPKAGLLTMMAGRLAGAPIRVHWFTGQVWATRTGFSRWFLKRLDRLLAACATHVLADSPSQRDFLVAEGVVKADKISVLGKGSVAGVDTALFAPNPPVRSKLRAELGIPASAPTALYLGRLNRDKGVLDLANAFLLAAREDADLRLIMVGPDEGGMRDSVDRILSDVSHRVHFVGFTREPQAFMAAADFFVMPSYREGFGSSVIEAAACGIPAVGSRIYGLRDAIADGETGILVPAGDIAAISGALIKFATDDAFRVTLGKQALLRVNRDFRRELLTDALLRYYKSLLERKVEVG